MKIRLSAVAIWSIAWCIVPGVEAQQDRRPYRLNAVDLKQRVIWGAECRQPNGKGLAFGGQDQDAEDGRPHTRVLVDGEWKAFHDELRTANPLQQYHYKTWSLRCDAKNLLARARAIYFQGLTQDQQVPWLRTFEAYTQGLNSDIQINESLVSKTSKDLTDAYHRSNAEAATLYMQQARSLLASWNDGISVELLKNLHKAQILLEQTAEALDAEPPPRAMNCGTARLPGGATGPESNTLVYDAKTKLYVIFGGDHLDYLTNDLWVFDPDHRRWFQRHPAGSPPPRANHRLEAVGDGTIRLTGGYTYTSNTGYVSGQYIDLDDGPWVYDIEKNEWSGGELVAADSRVYRTGPFHPHYYLAGPKPDAARFEAWLEKLPANQWTPTNPPHLPRLNRDWGTARIDPRRDIILRWSGGHSAHGGTDVLHFHFATNRWELPFPVEFPLGQLYSNTSYPNGFNFNLRPWMTGHTYQNYDYDPPSGKMIKAGRPRHYYVYDPDVGDWIGRGAKPAAMQYNSCFYTLTLVATPTGVVCWDKNGRVHQYDGKASKWNELELSGDPLPGARVDNSSIAYDSKRNRVLMVDAIERREPFDGQVWALDLKTHNVQPLSPEGRERASALANVDKCCYDAAHDLLLMGTHLKDVGDHTPTPAYDCANNRWITLNLKYETGQRLGKTRRNFPHSRSDGLMYDARRQLIWGTDTNSQVYVLRIDLDRADVKPL